MSDAETLWVLAHPERGIMFALASNPNEAWEAAGERLYGLDSMYEGGPWEAERKRLRREGWRARRCRVEVLP